MNGSDVFLIAGEPSGDLHGAALIEELLKQDPTLRIHAVAGPRMRQFPIECVLKMEELAVMGFIDILSHLPRIARLFFSLQRRILELNPKTVVTIDYPGFNLRLQNSLKKHGSKARQIHYICPTVWAWGKKRIQTMAKSLDLGLAILPFEPACFSHTSLPFQYVGHPLRKAVASHVPDSTFRERLKLAPTDKILALFPGSRQKEIERNLPLMRATAEKLAAQDPSLRVIESQTVPPEHQYDLMKEAHLALAKSGTVTLELALHKTPMVVQYAIQPLDLFLATKIFKISLPHYSLPNLILQERAWPELFGPKLTPETLLSHAQTLWFDEKVRAECKKSSHKLWDVLGPLDASFNAARLIRGI